MTHQMYRDAILWASGLNVGIALIMIIEVL